MHLVRDGADARATRGGDLRVARAAEGQARDLALASAQRAEPVVRRIERRERERLAAHVDEVRVLAWASGREERRAR